MKLNQLGLTATGLTATKKLGKQVHKSTVAAGMEPTLKLGVLGIQIGQEQSKGATSIVEAQTTVAELIRLMRKCAKTIKYDGKLPATNDEDVWKTAIAIGRLYDGSGSHGANRAWDGLQELNRQLSSFKSIRKGTTILPFLQSVGVVDNPQFKTFTALNDVYKTIDDAAANSFKNDVGMVLDFVDYMMGAFADDADNFDDLQLKVIHAVATKLGFQT